MIDDVGAHISRAIENINLAFCFLACGKVHFILKGAFLIMHIFLNLVVHAKREQEEVILDGGCALSKVRLGVTFLSPIKILIALI